MNDAWQTPPDGDFARYVERLMQQSQQRSRAAQTFAPGAGSAADLEPVAQTPAGAQRPAAADRAGGDTAVVPRPQKGVPQLLKVFAAVWTLFLLGMWSSGVISLVLLVALVVVGLVVRELLRRVLSPVDLSAWRQRVDQAVAQARRESSFSPLQKARQRSPK